MLFVLPLWLVLTTHIRHKRTKTLLIAVFTSNILTLAVSLAYLLLYLTSKSHPDGMLIYVMMTHIQVRRLSLLEGDLYSSLLNYHQGATSLMVANLVVDVLVINRFIRKAAGLSTFSDQSDTETITDDRAVETAPAPHSNAGNDTSQVTTNSTSLGIIDFTPLSTAIHTESQ